MSIFYQEPAWNIRIQEFLYKLNILFEDGYHEISYEKDYNKHLITEIKPEEYIIRFYNKSWDSYEGVRLDFQSQYNINKNYYNNEHALTSLELQRVTVEAVKIKKLLDAQELFPEFYVY